MVRIKRTALCAAGIILALTVTKVAAIAQGAQLYTIGYVSDFSGPFVDTFSPVYDGFRAHIEKVNAAGGIDGHPVKIIVRDDQLNATRAASLVRELATT